MTRALAVVGLLALSGTAHAGGYLAGGYHGSPTTSFASGMPSLKAGYGTRKFAGYGSVGFLRGALGAQDNEWPWVVDVNGFALKPMVGFRPALGDASKPVVGVLDVGAYTWIWGIGGDEDEIDPPKQDADAGLRPIGGLVAGLGLDAEVNENLSISASIGLDFFTAGYQFDGYVYHADWVTTWSAIYVNVWL